MKAANIMIWIVCLCATLVLTACPRSAGPGPGTPQPPAPPGSPGPDEPAEMKAQLVELYALPGAVCEVGGFAQTTRGYVLSACSSTMARSFCGSDVLPSSDIAGKLLVLEPEKGTIATKLALPEGSFGGAAWDGERLWVVQNPTTPMVRGQRQVKGVVLGIDLDAAVARKSALPEGEVVRQVLGPGGSIGGMTHDGRNLWVHDVERDILVVMDAEGNVVRELATDSMGKMSVNGIAFVGKRLYAAINGTTAGPECPCSDAPSAIIEVSPEDGRVLARFLFPADLYPHDMVQESDTSLLVQVQKGTDMRAPMYLYRVELLESPGEKMLSGEETP